MAASLLFWFIIILMFGWLVHWFVKVVGLVGFSGVPSGRRGRCVECPGTGWGVGRWFGERVFLLFCHFLLLVGCFLNDNSLVMR